MVDSIARFLFTRRFIAQFFIVEHVSIQRFIRRDFCFWHWSDCSLLMHRIRIMFSLPGDELNHLHVHD